MDLDNGTIKGLILVREQQKRDAEAEAKKLEMTPYQKAQLDLERQKLSYDTFPT